MRGALPLLALLALSACPAPLPSMEGLEIQVVPSAPDPGDELEVAIVAHAFAFDAEGFRYEYAWTVDGDSAPDEADATVPVGLTPPGEVWEVTVTPVQELEDETRTGPPATDSVTVAD